MVPGCLCRNMTSYWNQYLVLQGRAVAAYTRNPANVAGRTIMAIFVAVFAGMIFMRPPAGSDLTSRMTRLCLTAKSRPGMRSRWKDHLCWKAGVRLPVQCCKRQQEPVLHLHSAAHLTAAMQRLQSLRGALLTT